MREALGFLTVLGGPSVPHPRALRWFPLVGAVVGALVGGLWWAAGEAFPVLLAAALAIAADAGITGMLHLDGLADAADGLLSHAAPARRLEIMRTPGVGAYGIVATVIVLIISVAALDARSPDIGLLVALWCASRTVAAVTPALVPYVRDEGIASPFLAAKASVWPALALVPAAGLAVVTIGLEGLAAVAATVLGASAVVGFARSRIGGFTGDVLGAAIAVGQTVGLVVAAARW